jgi:hypothetical protein
MNWTIRSGVILAHAFVPWAVCGAVMMIGRQVTSLDTALVIHAIAAPIVFGLVAWLYFSRFGYTTPFQTAAIFLGFAFALDAGLVAPVFERSYAMFGSVLGTWIPFALIFASTYLVGTRVRTTHRTTLRTALRTAPSTTPSRRPG